MGDDPWDKRLAQTLIADVNRAHRAIAHQVLSCEEERGSTVADCLADYENTHAREAQLYFTVLQELRDAGSVSLSAAAVAVRALMEMANG